MRHYHFLNSTCDMGTPPPPIQSPYEAYLLEGRRKGGASWQLFFPKNWILYPGLNLSTSFLELPDFIKIKIMFT